MDAGSCDGAARRRLLGMTMVRFGLVVVLLGLEFFLPAATLDYW